jgi:uncharacterized protein YecT (DUF1311 family)
MNRSLLLLAITFLLLGSVVVPAVAQTSKSCLQWESSQAFREGFEHQQAKRTSQAVRSYERCLELEPGCEACHYEIGWSFWVLEQWGQVISHWEKVLQINANNADAKVWLAKARAKGDRISRAERAQDECEEPANMIEARACVGAANAAALAVAFDRTLLHVRSQDASAAELLVVAQKSWEEFAGKECEFKSVTGLQDAPNANDGRMYCNGEFTEARIKTLETYRKEFKTK